MAVATLPALAQFFVLEPVSALDLPAKVGPTRSSSPR